MIVIPRFGGCAEERGSCLRNRTSLNPRQVIVGFHKVDVSYGVALTIALCFRSHCFRYFNAHDIFEVLGQRDC